LCLTNKAGSIPATNQPTNQPNQMTTNIELSDKASQAVSGLQARKTALWEIVKHRDSFSEKPLMACANVPGNYGSGCGFIHEAIKEINETICAIINRDIIDRNF
jgi:hypothetical protein